MNEATLYKIHLANIAEMLLERGAFDPCHYDLAYEPDPAFSIGMAKGFQQAWLSHSITTPAPTKRAEYQWWLREEIKKIPGANQPIIIALVNH